MNATNRIGPCRFALAAAIPPQGPHGGHLSLLPAAAGAPTNICCDGVATQPSHRPIADPKVLTDRDITACPKQARLQSEADDRRPRSAAAHPGDEGRLSPSPDDNLNRWGNLPRFLALQHRTLKIAFSHGLGGERPLAERREEAS
jgi:hypothetical protein